MKMSLPFMELKPLLGLIQIGTSLIIYDQDTNEIIEDVDEYDGYDDHPPYKIEGLRTTPDGRLMIIVRRI